MAPDPLDVVVVGSANVDVVLEVGRIPQPGETVLAHGRRSGPGGKGANQAAAASRSGAKVGFVGSLGADEVADRLRAELRAAGVDVTGVRTGDAPTGTAYVVVDERGENAIVVDPGANALLDLDAAQRDAVRGAAVLLCQLEVPVPAVQAALEAAEGLRVLNAAPARTLPAELTALLAREPEVVVTLGAAGALVGRRGEGATPVPGVPARAVVDTTGAGDTFCGAYAAARAAGADGLDAAAYGCAAASLSVERPGAATSAPSRADVLARLAG